MKAALSKFLTAAGVAGLLVSATPVSAQMSPAQMKAQKDRAAEAERQRVLAEHQRAAATRAQAAAAARQRAANAEAERQARVRKNATLLAARQQAAREGKINHGWAIGYWAYDNLTNCETGSGISFLDKGVWQSEEEGGNWLIENNSIIINSGKSENLTEYENKEVPGWAPWSPVKLTENYIVMESDGGHEVFFRCPQGNNADYYIKLQENSPELSKQFQMHDLYNRKSASGYRNETFYMEEQSSYAKGLNSWRKHLFQNAKDIFEDYIKKFPFAYDRSYAKNFLGIYYRYHEVDLQKSLVWFSQNYQIDPGGERAADSLLSAAEVSKELGDTQTYCLMLNKFLADYPFDAKYRLAPRLSDVSKLATCP